jgi:hypothetical protein
VNRAKLEVLRRFANAVLKLAPMIEVEELCSCTVYRCEVRRDAPESSGLRSLPLAVRCRAAVAAFVHFKSCTCCWCVVYPPCVCGSHADGRWCAVLVVADWRCRWTLVVAGGATERCVVYTI